MPDQQVLAGLAVAPSGLLDELCGIQCFGEHGNFDLQDLMCETGGRGFRSAESFFRTKDRRGRYEPPSGGRIAPDFLEAIAAEFRAADGALDVPAPEATVITCHSSLLV
jgi:hypothetical protein